MKTETVCSKCQMELPVKDVRAGVGINEIIVSVAPCTNPDCMDCSQCEDLVIANQIINQLKTTITKIEEKLKNVRMFLDGGYQMVAKVQPMSAAEELTEPEPKPADCDCMSRGVMRKGVHLPSCPLHSFEPTKFETHATKEGDTKPGANDLHPTKDIQIGGTTIPGIRKGSAKGTTANYSKPGGG